MKYTDVLKQNGIEDITVLSGKIQRKIKKYQDIMNPETNEKYRNEEGKFTPDAIEELDELNDDIIEGIADYVASLEKEEEPEPQPKAKKGGILRNFLGD